jgi:hypothetical protein
MTKPPQVPAADRAVSVKDNQPDPFDAIKLMMDDLYVETGNWADGTDIENADQAEVVDRLINDWKDAIDAADQARDAATRPLSDQVTAIRERWYPLTADTTKIKGIATRAKVALLAVKTRWANKLRAERDAEAKRLRDEAAKQAAEAAQAARDAAGNLEATEQAEDLIKAAQTTLKAAIQLEKPAMKGLRSEWVTTMTDPVEAARWAWLRHRSECEEFFLSLAKRDVREGHKVIAGFDIFETKVAV